jgi:hypothetical protein
MSDKPIVFCFKVFPGIDDDLIAFLKSLGPREKSSYIRLALRQFINGVKPLYNASSVSQITGAFSKASVERDGNSSNFAKPAEYTESDLEARLDRW